MFTRQLILIQQFFNDARRTPAAETPFVRLRRTLHLDLCVELALSAVVHEHGTTQEQNRQGGRRDLAWHELWELAEKVSLRKTSKSLPERQRLKTLHEVRNLAQHRGTVPSADEVHASVEQVRSLLEFVTRDLFGLNFETLNEWDALESEPLREWMSDCASAVDLDIPFVAASGAKLCYDLVVGCVQNAAAGPDAWLHRRTINVHSPELAEAIGALQENLQEVLTALESEIVAVSLGLNVAEHFRFQRIARCIHINKYGSGRHEFIRSRGWPSDDEAARSEAVFMVEYLGKAVLMLESAYPEVFNGLKFPFPLRESGLWKDALAAKRGEDS